MITKNLFTRLTISLALGISAFVVSTTASAHDKGHHRGWEERHHRGGGHWHRHHYHPREVVRVYERERYVVPRYNYDVVESRPRHNDGLTIIYRDSWR
jgi:hypothetical protein